MEYIAPLPYRFNPWKHHRQWVCNHLEMARKVSANKLTEEMLIYIKAINSNHVDVYTGDLSPELITQNVTNELNRLKVSGKMEFHNWLSKRSFHLLELCDSSVWVVRKGIDDERYIHFHPARNSPNAVRIHGNSWKTAIVARLLYHDTLKISLPIINEIRTTYLDLSPIKDLERNQRLHNAFELLE
jgi:hypothetical protein